MKFYLLLFAALLLFSPAAARAEEIAAKTLNLPLGETMIKVSVYEKAGARITFFAPHRNEQIAVQTAKEAVAQNGGRLIAIESFDKNGAPARHLEFTLAGKSYSADPNRIYTANGRRCANFSGAVEIAVRQFAEELLQIIFPAKDKSLKSGEKFLVAVHNNVNVEEKSAERRATDLTAHSFVENIAAGRGETSEGAFAASANGVFLANGETDADNFLFLSSPRFLGFFAENGFNAVVQKPAQQLQTDVCAVDDGSLSVFAGQRNIEYIALEADAAGGSARQKQMLAAVYRLLALTVEEKRAGRTVSAN
jgi:hypothetical protein